MQTCARFLLPIFLIAGLSSYAQVPIGTPRRIPRTTPRPTPVRTPKLSDRLTPPQTNWRDSGTSWKIKIGRPTPIRTKLDSNPRIRIKFPTGNTTARRPLLPGAPPARRIEEQQDPAKVIVARVAGEKMTLEQLRGMVDLALRGKTYVGPKEQVDELRARHRRWAARRILGDWIDTKLLVTEAKARGITVSDEEIDQQIKATAQDRQIAVPLAQRMQFLNLDEKEVRSMMADAVLCDKLVRSEIDRRVSDEMLREKYNSRPDLFWTPPSRHVQEIFCPFLGTETPSQLRKMKNEMQKIRRRLKWFGAKMEDYVDPTGKKGISAHDLGWLELGEPTVPKRQFLYNIVFALKRRKPGQNPEYMLKVGQISEVIQSPYGYHILKVVADRPPRRRTLEEARVEVENRFYNQIRDQLLKELRVKYQPRSNEFGLREQDEKKTAVAGPKKGAPEGMLSDKPSSASRAIATEQQPTSPVIHSRPGATSLKK